MENDANLYVSADVKGGRIKTWKPLVHASDAQVSFIVEPGKFIHLKALAGGAEPEGPYRKCWMEVVVRRLDGTARTLTEEFRCKWALERPLQ